MTYATCKQYYDVQSEQEFDNLISSYYMDQYSTSTLTKRIHSARTNLNLGDHKYCPVCETFKVKSDFYKHKSAADRLQSRCKDCSKAAAKEWQTKNYERYRKIIAEWNSNNASRLTARRNELYQKYNAKMLHKTGVNRSKSAGTYVDLTPEEEQYMIAVYQLSLDKTSETGIYHVVDHIIPFRDGGTHTPDNIQIITHSENLRKVHNPDYICNPVSLDCISL